MAAQAMRPKAHDWRCQWLPRVSSATKTGRTTDGMQSSDQRRPTLPNNTNEGWKRGDPIGYIRKEIPDFDVPAYEGERYEAMVPDTLDLQERAALAVHCLTSATDPDADYEQYWGLDFRTNPPAMFHDYADLCQMKFMEALPLMRIASGSAANEHVDRRWMEVALHQQGPDGLTYWPAKGRPWALAGAQGYMEELGAKTEVEQHIYPAYCGRLLSALMLYHKRDPDSVWKESAERLVDGLVELSVDRGSYAFYAPSSHWAEKGSTDEYGKRVPQGGAHVAFVSLGLVHVFREIGYEPAIVLADKLHRYVMEEIEFFDEEARYLGGRPMWKEGMAHFHMHTYVLLSLLEYAQATGDDRYLEFVRKGYEHGKSRGDTLLGYFPEFIGSPRLEHSELCEVADMIALGLKLTEAGVGDYLDDVDRWTRNRFAEGQLTPPKVDWLQRYSASQPRSQLDPMYQMPERAVERNVGAFAGWPKANDWYAGEAWGIMHCCTGNGTRAIHYVWQNMVTYTGGKFRVNLLLNRPSQWADVESHIPYVGQVDVRIKQRVDLSVRLPEWVKPDEARVQVNGDDRRVDWQGRYAVVGEVLPGDVATMTFPIAERKSTVWIEKESYALVRKGNDVVAIDPPGRICPLYQREHYRANETRWRRVERFVSDEDIHW